MGAAFKNPSEGNRKHHPPKTQQQYPVKAAQKQNTHTNNWKHVMRITHHVLQRGIKGMTARNTFYSSKTRVLSV
jgi:hypothetical protein